jgi:protein phosphatase
VEVGFKSDKGLQRVNNEDACFVLKSDKVYLVADGVGGGNAGEIASRTAVNEIANYIKEHPIGSITNKYAEVNYLQDCLDNANEKIYEEALRYEENRGMATTIAIIHAKGGKIYIANVGDSRVYLYRNGELLQLTEDHTYVNTLLKAGVISAEEAATDKRKNVITKALGADNTVEPDFFQVKLLKDDIFIACTDGLYDELDKDKMIEILDRNLSMSDICCEMVNAANENGGHDNITIISLKVTEEEFDEQ